MVTEVTFPFYEDKYLSIWRRRNV